MQAPAGPFPRADAAPTQPQGCSGKHCVASAHKRSMLEVEMGGVWGGEAFLRPFLHWQCQLGTVPYTVPYFTVITVKYGVTITVVRRNLTSTVRTVQTVTVPYRTTRQACSIYIAWGLLAGQRPWIHSPYYLQSMLAP